GLGRGAALPAARAAGRGMRGRAMAMTAELRRWRADRREELIARRLAASPEERHAWSERITRQLLDAFPMLQRCVVGFCWPYRGEFDPRFAVRRLREGGARAALPRV